MTFAYCVVKIPNFILVKYRRLSNKVPLRATNNFWMINRTSFKLSKIFAKKNGTVGSNGYSYESDFTLNCNVQWRFPAAGLPSLSVQFPALVSSYSLVQKQPPAIPGFIMYVWGIFRCNWLSDLAAATNEF